MKNAQAASENPIYKMYWNPINGITTNKAWKFRIECMYRDLYPNISALLERSPNNNE